MSGGVDSSVAAALLQRDGYEVLGAFMRLGSPQGCRISRDLRTKRQEQAGMLLGPRCSRCAPRGGVLEVPFYVLNFQEEFGG